MSFTYVNVTYHLSMDPTSPSVELNLASSDDQDGDHDVDCRTAEKSDFRDCSSVELLGLNCSSWEFSKLN